MTRCLLLQTGSEYAVLERCVWYKYQRWWDANKAPAALRKGVGSCAAHAERKSPGHLACAPCRIHTAEGSLGECRVFAADLRLSGWRAQPDILVAAGSPGMRHLQSIGRSCPTVPGVSEQVSLCPSHLQHRGSSTPRLRLPFPIFLTPFWIHCLFSGFYTACRVQFCMCGGKGAHLRRMSPCPNCPPTLFAGLRHAPPPPPALFSELVVASSG